MTEHRRPDGTLAQGYYCSRCGAAGVNMLASGHGLSRCEPNPALVDQLRVANALPEACECSPAFEDKAVTAYWLKHYCTTKLCDLCGNRGYVIGYLKAEHCICPNGQAARHHGVVPGTRKVPGVVATIKGRP